MGRSYQERIDGHRPRATALFYTSAVHRGEHVILFLAAGRAYIPTGITSTIRCAGAVRRRCTEKRRSGALERIMPPASSNIEELHLKKECFVSMDKLTVVIASARRLTTFSYDLCSPLVADDDELEQMLGSKKLSDILHCQRFSLESLQLTTHFSQTTLPLAIRFQRLGAFQSLRQLYCPIMSVHCNHSDMSTTFMDMFPSSLDTLHLTVPPYLSGDTCKRSVEHLVKNYPVLAPALRELRVSPWSYHNWKRCESLCSKLGLAFKTDKPPVQDWVLLRHASRNQYVSSSDSSDECYI